MKIRCTLVLFIGFLVAGLCGTAVQAQVEDNIWAFGNNAALDFNSGTPVALTGYTLSSAEGSASISDATGNILFYSGGSTVRNALHTIMPNGSGILGHTGSGTQSVVIVKKPGSDSLYYLFSLDEYMTSPAYLRYNLIDMSLDGGNGDVVVGEKNIIIDTNVIEKMTVTKDDACNYWLVLYSSGTNQYRSFNISPDGIGPKIVSAVPTASSSIGVGEIKISPDGTKIANSEYQNGYIEVADFDKTTGIVSGFMRLEVSTDPYGCAFSPNSQVLYCATPQNIYQFDLATWPVEATIEASMTTFYNSSLGYPQMRNATNGKIYFPASTPYTIGAIENPNTIGIGATVNFSAFSLPTTSSVTFSLGASVVINDDLVVNDPVTHDSLLCYVDSLVLEGPLGFAAYAWDDGSASRLRTVYGSGTYWIISGNSCDARIDTFHIVMVDSNINLINNDTVICMGSVLTLGVAAAPGYTYHWTPEDGVADPFSPTTTWTATDSRYISVAISYPGCAPFTKTFFADVKEAPVVEIGEDKIICSGKSVSIFPDIPDADEDYIFLWTPAIGVSDPTAMDVVLSPTVSTTYYLIVNAGAAGCDMIDSMRVSVIPSVIDLLNNDTVICSGTTLPLNVIGHPAFAYYWTPETGIANPLVPNTGVTPTASGFITVTASREGCDDMSDSFFVELQPTPVVNIGDDLTICGGVATQLYASVTPDYAGYTYEWRPGLRLNDSTIKEPIYTSYATSEQLVLSVTTPHGCVGRDTLMATVTPKVPLTVNTNDTGFCLPGQVQLEAFNADEYVWTPALGLSDDSISNPIASPDYSTTYMVIGYTAGCPDTQYVDVAAYASGTIYLADSVTIYPGEEYEIDLDGNASYYAWFPPEGLSDANIANPIASPYVRTRYYVTARTEHGCTVKDSIDIVVNTGYVFDVPNAFAPGNNFVNNGSFKILKRGDVTLNSFQVYNRWGQQIFETADINQGWDGTFDGKAQPMGVYVYLIEGTLGNGQSVKLHGNVTLVR